MDYYRFTVAIPKPWQLLRLRLSTLLLLTAIASMALAWRRDRQTLLAEIDELRNPSPAAWSVEQLLGPPDTTGFGDKRTAWASATQDGQMEWLIVEYDRPVTPEAVVIHETYNPGAVVKVARFDLFGIEQVLWEGQDPTPSTAAGGVSRIPLAYNKPVDRLKIYIDSPAVPGWNEIDAVGIVHNGGRIQWAAGAKSSSSYGSRQTGPVGRYNWYVY